MKNQNTYGEKSFDRADIDTACDTETLKENMGKAEKRMRAWSQNTPSDVPVSEVKAVLKRYFPGGYEEKGGSHIIVRDERLKGCEGFGIDGDFPIAVKGGQRVKGVYLKRLVKAIELMGQRGEAAE